MEKEKDFQIFEIDIIVEGKMTKSLIKKRIFEIDRSIENSITKRARFSKTE